MAFALSLDDQLAPGNLDRFMSEEIKFKLRAMSLGVLPSDARAQNIDLSAIEANANVRRQPAISNDDLEECGARSQASSHPSESDPDGRMQLRRASVTFQDDLPGTPITAASIQSASPESSPQDKHQSSSEVPASALKSSVRPHRRGSNETALPSRSPPAGVTPQPPNTFETDYKRSGSLSPPERPVQKREEPVEHHHGRRFSILFGTSKIPEPLPPEALAEHGPNPRTRRKAVYLNRGISMLSLGEVDKHIKHMDRLDFVYAILSLGGLGMAVSQLLGK